MRFLRVTAHWPRTYGPFCAPECVAKDCGKPKTHTWDYVIPETFSINDYVMVGHLATGGMMGESISHISHLWVEDGIEADYEYDHIRWRDDPSSHLKKAC